MPTTAVRCAILLAASYLGVTATTLTATLPEFSGPYQPTGPFPQPAVTVGTFTYTIPAGEHIIAAVINGEFGNSFFPDTAGVDVYAGGVIIARCVQLTNCDTTLTAPSPFSFTFSPVDFSNLTSGMLQVTAIQTGGNYIRLSQLKLTIVTSGSAVAGLRFVPLAPCRVLDTRNATGPYGGPRMAAGGTRDVAVPQSPCGVPGGAQAYSFNVTVVPPGPLGYLTIWPAGLSRPTVSTLNSLDGRIVANAAIVPTATSGAISLFVSDATDVILDVNGYFIPDTGQTTMAFYPVSPCRLIDTRGAGFRGAFGPPALLGGASRSFAIPASGCNVPATAQAFSFNVTAVPHGPLGYMTIWPTGQTQPLVSTLNSTDGSVVANAAIVPSGSGGSVSLFVTNDTDVVIDINGYFAPPGFAGAELFYPVTPCRVADTRGGFAGPFGPPTMSANASRDVPVPTSSCGLPPTAQAYALNVTVVPSGPLNYLTAWPTGKTQPLVSTLNSPKGNIVANAALVPAGTGGSVSFFVTDLTDLILDINGYFAP